MITFLKCPKQELLKVNGCVINFVLKAKVLERLG